MASGQPLARVARGAIVLAWLGSPRRTPHHDRGPLEGLRWDSCHTCARNTGFVQRFEVEEALKNWFLTKATYE